jgi:hypothetical protein
MSWFFNRRYRALESQTHYDLEAYIWFRDDVPAHGKPAVRQRITRDTFRYMFQEAQKQVTAKQWDMPEVLRAVVTFFRGVVALVPGGVVAWPLIPVLGTAPNYIDGSVAALTFGLYVSYGAFRAMGEWGYEITTGWPTLKLLRSEIDHYTSYSRAPRFTPEGQQNVEDYISALVGKRDPNNLRIVPRDRLFKADI